ncbi:GTP-binding protein LepA [Streptococcus pneumoniae]|nr:GTP-binding protein LepA [Streptococcus pneumoniae]
MIKILAACGAGVNSSHQIKSALEEELSNRGYDVHCDAVMVKDVNEDLMKGYDIFTPIAATDLGFEPETSQALGFGFRCGFLGLLHMDVIQERLEREFNIDLIMTAPSVIYKVNLTDGESMDVSNPSEFPDPTKIATIEEPYVKAQIMVPQEFVGAVMELAQRKRGDFVTMDYIDDNRVNVIYQIPLAEIVFDFFDKLKSSTRGYASFDYELSEYRPSYCS